MERTVTSRTAHTCSNSAAESFTPARWRPATMLKLELRSRPKAWRMQFSLRAALYMVFLCAVDLALIRKFGGLGFLIFGFCSALVGTTRWLARSETRPTWGRAWRTIGGVLWAVYALGSLALFLHLGYSHVALSREVNAYVDRLQRKLSEDDRFESIAVSVNNWHMKPRVEIVGVVRSNADLIALNLTKGSMSRPSGVAVNSNVIVTSSSEK